MSNTDNNRQILTQAKRIVVKAGTHVLADKSGKPNATRIRNLVRNIAGLQQEGIEVVLVTSGAIGVGMQVLGMRRTASTPLSDLQMTAAVGQSHLMELYHKYFTKHNCIISQVLLTHDDLRNRQRHLNARNAMLNLLNHKIIPIVNENDVVSVDEIRVGDNDVLSAMVAALIQADTLILLTTPNGFYQTLPNGKKKRIPYLETINDTVLQHAKGKSSALSIGGMASKLQAAQMANKSGSQVVIASGFQKDVLKKVMQGEDVGTLIEKQSTIHGRKRWVAFFHRAQGELIIDNGAANAVQQKGKSLLPVGVREVKGNFTKGALVNIISIEGINIGQGLVAYSSDEIKKIAGKHGDEIAAVLGSKGHDEIVHRDNMNLMP